MTSTYRPADWAFAWPVTEAAKAYGLHQAMYAIPVLCVVLAAVLAMGAHAAVAQAASGRR